MIWLRLGVGGLDGMRMCKKGWANILKVGDECLVRVFGAPDDAQWYNLWEAAVAVFSTCVRGAQGGVVRNLGEFFS